MAQTAEDPEQNNSMHSSSNSFSSEQNFKFNKHVSHNDLNFVLANARSLRPKLYSLVDTLEEMEGHLAVITETWFRSSPQLEELLRDAEDTTGYGFIRKDRQETGQESRGGGVAIVYKKSNIEMTQLKVQGKFEIVASLGRRTGQKRKIVTIGAYIPPAADAETSKEFLNEIANAVRRFKTKYCSPYFIIAGDFNKRKIAKELKEFCDIKLVKTGPTRGRQSLDLIFTNFPQFIKNCGTLPALFNAEGTCSDHLAVHLHARVPRVPDYTIERYTYVRHTEEGDKAFEESFCLAKQQSQTCPGP